VLQVYPCKHLGFYGACCPVHVSRTIGIALEGSRNRFSLMERSPEQLNDPFENEFYISFGDKPESDLSELERCAREHLTYHRRMAQPIGILR
jgi:hypothetical protein